MAQGFKSYFTKFLEFIQLKEKTLLLTLVQELVIGFNSSKTTEFLCWSEFPHLLCYNVKTLRLSAAKMEAKKCVQV